MSKRILGLAMEDMQKGAIVEVQCWPMGSRAISVLPRYTVWDDGAPTKDPLGDWVRVADILEFMDREER